MGRDCSYMPYLMAAIYHILNKGSGVVKMFLLNTIRDRHQYE